MFYETKTDTFLSVFYVKETNTSSSINSSLEEKEYKIKLEEGDFFELTNDSIIINTNEIKLNNDVFRGILIANITKDFKIITKEKFEKKSKEHKEALYATSLALSY